MKKYAINILFCLLSATILRAQSNTQLTIGNSQLTGDTLFSTSPEQSILKSQSSTAIPQFSTGNSQLSTKLDSLIRNSPLLETSQLGLMVWDLTADSALYAYNHRHRMRPASTMKLLTAITALDLYGGDHRFTTELRYKGQIVGRTLVGDLVCVGGMDPTFDNGGITYFVDCIRAAGIDTICGRIVADKSMKDTLLLGEGWCWDDDNPCLSALLLNRKDNFVERLTTRLNEVGVVIMEYGTLNMEHETLNMERGTLNMEQNGQLSIVNCQLDKVLTRMMKQSDNLYAEAIFYHTALSAARPATQENARTAVRQLIQRLGYDPAQYNIADGSGLSLYNYLSPELLTAFLRHAWRNNRIFAHLEPSLPVAGVDGTLRGRMKNTRAHRNVRAKTGSLMGVSSLAGYATAANGHRLAFAVINQGIAKSKDAKAFQDTVCQLLCE